MSADKGVDSIDVEPLNDTFPGHRARLIRAHGPWAVPVLASLTLSASMIGRTTFGRDEMATWEFSQLSLPHLARAVGHIDAVLAPYYLLIHLWSFGGDGAVWLRLPSALSVAAAVGLAARLGQRSCGPVTGLITGFALALHPVVATAAVTARPYAAALLLCTAGTVLVLQPGTLRLRRYVVVMTAAVWLHLFAILVGAVHLLVERRRDVLVGAVATGVLSIPLAIAAHHQRVQLAYLTTPTVTMTRTAIREGAFPGVHLWLAIAAVAVLLASIFGGSGSESDRKALLTGVGLTLVPAVFLYVVSHLSTPVLNTRYEVGAPLGYAILLGGAAGAVARTRVTSTALRRTVSLAALGTLLVTAVPSVRAVRAPVVHGARYREAAAILATHAKPGDGIEVAIRHSQGGTVAGLAYYSGDRAFLHEILAGLPAGEPLIRRRLVTGPGTTTATTTIYPRQWFVGVAGTTPAVEALGNLRAQGCLVHKVWYLGDLILVRLRHCPGAA